MSRLNTPPERILAHLTSPPPSGSLPAPPVGTGEKRDGCVGETFYIIDGHSQIFRAYYAPFRELTSPSGEPTRATYVFTNMLLEMLQHRRPDYLAMAMDTGRESLERTRIFSDYKANREAPPEDLPVQSRRIEQIVRAMGIPVWSGAGQEADDYLASGARQYAREGLQVVLVSRDKDLEQLLGEQVVLYDPMTGETTDPAALEAAKGYRPDKAVEIQTLTGDSTDNVPGVKGIGVKTAAKLIARYGTAEGVLAHADELTPKQRENVLAFAEQMPLTRQLVTLRQDLPLGESLADCRWRGVDLPAVVPIFRELGFTRLVSRLEAQAAPAAVDAPAPAPAAGAAAAPEAAAEAAAEGPTPPAGPAPTTAEDFDYRLVDTREGLDALIASLAGVKRLAVDTETTSRRPMSAELVGVSLAWEAGVGHYLPVRGPMGSRLLAVERLRETLGPILADPAVKKVGHNLKYDAIVLAQAGMPIAPAGIGFDTYLAAYVLDAAAPGKLDDVAMRYLHHRCIPIGEMLGTGAKAITMDFVPTEATAVYAAEDAEVSLRLAEVLGERLDAEGLTELFERAEMPLVSVLAEMQQRGIRVDPQQLKRQETALAKRAAELRDRIIELAGPPPFNPDSPKQLGEVLFERLSLPVIRRTKTGPSTDAGVLNRLAAEHELPAVVLDYRQLTKLLSTYLRALAGAIHPVTGRVHASFNQAGTITGRLSSSEPNLQNIPIRTEVGRQIRSAFVAEAGHLLLSADYSQIELRVLAHFCRDQTLLDAFEANQDIHRIVAGEVFGVPPEEVTADQRARAKTVNFGIIYGQTAHGLAQTLRIGRGEAAEFISRYKRRFPAIEGFLAECVAEAKARGYVETILKRRRPIENINSRSAAPRAAAERMAINSVIQGSAADLIKLAMINVHRRIVAEGRPSRMLLQIHDELVFEVPAEAVEAEREMIVSEMTGAMALDVPLKVDTGVGENWMAAK